MTIKAIETRFDGYRFRSRTEARWAVFFKSAGIEYEYEPQGFDLDGVPYLPDFWLPQSEDWFEVKGQPPTERETKLCEMLAEKSGKSVLLAIGAPDPEQDQVRVCYPAAWRWLPSGYRFSDRFAYGGKPVLALAGESRLMLKEDFVHGGFQRIAKAYRDAKEARFEHGERPLEAAE